MTVAGSKFISDYGNMLLAYIDFIANLDVFDTVVHSSGSLLHGSS